MGHTDPMSKAAIRKVPVAEAKANFSQLVDAAEHHGRRTLITRHGKPAAMLVPIDVVGIQKPKRKRMTRDEALAFIDSFAGQGDPSFSAVDDVVEGR